MTRIAPLEIYRTSLPISLVQLRRDLARAEATLPFDDGPFQCSIPLVPPELLHSDFAQHYNNSPFANIIGRGICPSFQAVFNLIDAPKSSFRLIRKSPKSTYELHEDQDRGENVCRFQVPIFSGPEARLCMSTMTEIKEDRSDPDVYTPDSFAARFEACRIESLAEGWLYAFNVDCIHTLHNGEDSDRITLLMDVVMDEGAWSWWENNMTCVPGSTKVRPATTNSQEL